MPLFDPGIFDPDIFDTGETSGGGSTATGLRMLPGVDLHGVMPLVRGDDYLDTNGRAVFVTEGEFDSNEAWPDLAGATVVLTLRIAGTPSVVDGVVVAATGSEKQVRFSIDHDSIPLVGNGVFDVQATLADNSIATLRAGKATILQDVTT